MAVFETWLKSDLQKAVQVKSIQGNLFSADNAGNLIGVVITNGGSPAEITGVVTAYIIRADGATVVVEGSLSGNRASVTLPASAYAVVGQASIVIKVGTTTVGACTIYVYRSTTDTIVDPGEVIPSITELLEKIDEMEQGTAAANTAAQNANTAATSATTAASKIDNMTVEASKLPESASPTAQISEVSGHKHIAFGIPQGVTQTEFDDLSEQVSDLEVQKASAIYEEIESGSIATFTDGADDMPLKNLSVAIEPVQDLHGQDAPYPAGGGKNLLPKGVSSTNNGITFTVNDDGTVTVTGTATTTAFWGVNFTIPAGSYILNGCPANGGGESYTLDIRDAVGGSGISGIVVDTGNGSTFTLAESLTAYVNIRIARGYACPSGGVLIKPMIRLSSVSDATFAPYSNICPISGWTGAKVTRTGKNLLDASTVTSGLALDVNSGATIENTNWSVSDFIAVKGSNITLSWESDTHYFQARICYYDASKTFISGESTALYVYSNTYSLPATARYVRFSWSDVVGSNPANRRNIRVNLGNIDQGYTPYYQGETIEYAFPQSAGTVYGGTLTVNEDETGTLKVTHKMWTADGTTPWTLAGAGTSDVSFYSQSGYANDTDVGNSNGLSNYFGYNYSFSTRGTVMAYSNRINLNPGSGFETVEELQAAFAQNPLQVLYPLATPQTYTLTASQVTTLLGTNNIWADTGDVSVEYPADTKLYIDGKIAQLQALILENISNS